MSASSALFTTDSEDLAILSARLSGMSRGQGRTLYVAPIVVPGAARALYVELVQDGRENGPVLQQVWVPHLRQGEMRVRAFELPLMMRSFVIGFWAAPELWPRAGLEQFKPLGDLSAEMRDDTAYLRAAAPLVMARDGAIELQFEARFSRDETEWFDAGIDERELTVWKREMVMRRIGNTPAADRQANGLIVWDLRPGSGAKVENKDSVAINWASYHMGDGHLLDKNAGVAGREDLAAYFFTLPNDKVIQGWNLGVLGAQKGTIRRIFVPSRLAFGAQAAGPIPANSDLLFEIEVADLKDNTP